MAKKKDAAAAAAAAVEATPAVASSGLKEPEYGQKSRMIQEAIASNSELSPKKIAELLNERAAEEKINLTFKPQDVSQQKALQKKAAGGGGSTRKAAAAVSSSPKFSFSEVTMKVQEFSSKFGADELLDLAENLPALVNQVGGAEEFRKMVELLGKK